MSALHEAFDEIAADVPAYGDLDRAIEQADHERHRRRLGVVAGLAAAAAVVAVVIGVLAVTRDGNDAPRPIGPSPTPTDHQTAIDPAQRNGRITGARRYFGPKVSNYQWRSFDPVSEIGLFVTAVDPDRSYDIEGLAVVGPTGPVATLTCARDLQCSPEEDWLSYAAALGPGADEITVESGDRTAQVIGYDGTLRRTLDLTATIPDGGAITGLGWSPDGGRLAVVDSSHQVWLVDGGDSASELAHRATVWGNPLWSPDGKTLLLDVQIGRTYGADVVALRLPPDGAADPVIAQTLYRSSRHFDWAGNLAWSPDGTRIAVRTRIPGSPGSAMSHRITVISAEDGTTISQHPNITGWLIWAAREG
jgi:WD40 repeat protein